MEIRYVAAPDPTCDLAGVTELRVHGVGGTTPEQMLDEPHPRQVAGDRIAGFFRRPDTEGRHVEAYSWGGLTSRSALRVLWLLLLPFTLANLAGWMHRAELTGGSRLAFRSLVRVLGLGLTATYALWMFGIASDLVAYQCGGQPQCLQGRWWLGFLDWWWVAGYPARRVVLGALVPAAAIVALGWLARATRQRYEAVDRNGGSSAEEFERAYAQGLDAQRFWRGEELVSRLGRIHLAGAFATLAWALAVSTGALGGQPVAAVIGAFAGVQLLACAVAVCLPSRLPDALVSSLSAVCMTTLGAAALAAIGAPAVEGGGVPGRLPGLGAVAVTVLAVHVVLLLGLGAFLLRVLVHARQERGVSGPAVFRWGGPLVAATLATLTLDAFFAGTAVRVADLLGTAAPGGVTAVAAGGPWIVYPQIYDLFAAALTLVLLSVGVVVLAVWAWRWRGRWQQLVDQLREEYAADDAPTLRDEPSWLRRIARTRYLSQAVDGVDVALTAMVLVALVLAVLGLLARFPAVPAGRLDLLLTLPRGPWSWVWTTSTWIVSFIPLGAVALMRYAHRNPELRRKVGILWDVGSFWPRAFHPLAPPSYAERAVPDLQRRIRRLTDSGGRVILSAHSQGTVLAAAALLQLPPETRYNVAFVTYGCPLTRLYGRFFPAYLGSTVLVGLRRTLTDGAGQVSLPRWRNYYRLTDLIGGPVFAEADEDDVRLPDPLTSRYTPGEPWPSVAGHSGYLEDPAMMGFVAQLAEALLGSSRPRPQNLPS